MTLLGETLDHQLIADLAIQSKQTYCKPVLAKHTSRTSLTNFAAEEQTKKINPVSLSQQRIPHQQVLPVHHRRCLSVRSYSQISASEVALTASGHAGPGPFLFRMDSQEANREKSDKSSGDVEDRMRKIRKTFAGIFGDM
ncbi:synapsin [Nephila pilipes]|uniref:Synapsin n=1 Tax=Nephila pilipes TaxID=299642 RepID=A0A8X6PL76_NEPPI|nr:synapsin [Nephila pilipes]